MLKSKFYPFLLAVILSLFLSSTMGYSCTNILVTKGASADGSVMVTYSADSPQLYGELYYHKGSSHPAGSKIEIYEWDSGKYLGDIAQVAKTYTTVGNMNEYQLIITETTFGGRGELTDTTGIIDYGSLIYLTLQRAKTAREAIKVMTDLVEEYGFASSGESFSIADKDEVWVMEMIGKGTKMEGGVNKRKGAVWVAVKIPDGYITAHANQARITTFPLNDPENCIYSPDVISFAKEMGYYKGKDKNFSFTDAYAPANFSALRACEARVWAAFNILGDGMIGDKHYTYYTDFAMGHNAANKMPLYIKPAKKLTVKDVADAMRDHYTGTVLDMREDIGAGGNELPYRWRPLSWEYEGERYYNERAIATQQTGFWILGQARSWLPDEIGGILWFAVDDAATSPLTPIYSSSLDVPDCFREGNGSLFEYSETSAFWLFNRVSNFAYSRYNIIYPDIKIELDNHECAAIERTAAIDQAALALHKESPMKAREFLTDYSVNLAQQLFNNWVKLDRYLLMKHVDGLVKHESSRGVFMDNGYGRGVPKSPATPGYSDRWKRKVIEETGDKLKVVEPKR